jgi:hypothetical protein
MSGRELGLQCASAAIPLASFATQMYSEWKKAVRKRAARRANAVKALQPPPKKVYSRKLRALGALYSAASFALGALALVATSGAAPEGALDCGRFRTCAVPQCTQLVLPWGLTRESLEEAGTFEVGDPCLPAYLLT